MTTTEKYETELEVLKEVIKYKECYPDDVSNDECSLAYVLNCQMLTLKNVGGSMENVKNVEVL